MPAARKIISAFSRMVIAHAIPADSIGSATPERRGISIKRQQTSFNQCDLMRMKDTCPACFSEIGFSVVMHEEKGIYFCPKDAQHRFKKTNDGFFERFTQ